jgi:hypothetical protein
MHLLQTALRRTVRPAVAGGLALIFIVSSIHAQSSNPYQLTSSLSAGGGILSGGSYQVGASLGQSTAGEATGGGYTVGGGIFGGGPVTPQQPPRRLVNLPLVRR